MKHVAHSRRERWVLATGVTLILVLVALRYAMPFYLSWRRDNIEYAAEAISELTRAQTLAREYAASLDTLARQKAEFVLATVQFLDAGSQAAAEASLAMIIRESAENAGVQLSSILLRTDTAGRAVIKRVQARASMTGDISGIMAMLQSIENSPDLLVIRELSINQPEPAAADDKPEALQVDIAVQGIYLDTTAARIR